MRPSRHTPSLISSLLFALALSGCAEDSEPSEQSAAETTETTETEPAAENAVAMTTENATDASASPIDPEMCGDLSVNGALDLPMPDASIVTITGRDEDPSLGAPNALSNAGRYRVTLSSVGEIFVGHPFEMVVNVEQTEDGAPALQRMRITPDAYMPQHFHGMNVLPGAQRTGEGEYTVTGMAFHMKGLWEVYIDVTDLGVAERAQFTFKVE